MQSSFINNNVHINPVFDYISRNANYFINVPNISLNATKSHDVTKRITISPNKRKPEEAKYEQVPYETLFSKGWFFHCSCDTRCIQNTPFELQSCCFINDKNVPSNTIDLNKFRQTALEFYKSKTSKKSPNNLLVSLSKHKLVRKLVENSKDSPKRKIPPLILCTKRKLIRKTKLNPVPLISLKKYIIKPHSLVKIEKDSNEAVCKRKRPVLMLTKRKLIRKNVTNDSTVRKIDGISTPVAETNSEFRSPEKLVALNRNKLVRSSLLVKTQTSGSVLHHIIRNRRRPHPGGGYILLTRNKLIKKAKNKTWKKKAQSDKVFVSLGSNKLIRKSLFTKNNKNEDKISPVLSSIKNRRLVRMLNSPSRRIQTFTNHLTRRSLRYINGKEIFKSRNRFTNKHKNNKKVLRKKRNRVCPLFRRNGTCSKLLKGDCTLIHDKKYVTLCKNFINGTCDKEDCLLSHDFVSKKISVCQRFICDNCHSENCPYLHVKPPPEAPICVQFLNGYCDNGEKCTSWHVSACSEFKNTSKCQKGDKCRLPHRNLDYFEGKFTLLEEDDASNWRYFEKNKLDDKVDIGISIIPERQSLGDLPDYIPF